MELRQYFAFTPAEQLQELHGITKNISEVISIYYWNVSIFFQISTSRGALV